VKTDRHFGPPALYGSIGGPVVHRLESVGKPHPAAREPAAAHPRVCLLGANFSGSNNGVNALAHSALQLIYEHDPEAEILILDYHRTVREYMLDWNGRHIPVLNLRFSRRFFLKTHIVRLLLTALLLRFVPGSWLRGKLLERNPVLARLGRIETFAAVSGGDSFSDIYGIRRLLYVSLPQVLGLLLGKRLVQLPQTYGPFARPASRLLARWILDRSELIYSRDYEGISVAAALSRKAAERVRFCYDMAFALKPEPGAGPWDRFLLDNPDAVGLNVNGLLYNRPYEVNASRAAEYRSLVERLVETFVEELGVPVLLVPHVYGDGPMSESDVKASRELYERLAGRYGARLYLLEDRLDQNKVKYVIGRLSFFAGSRMHACIAAISQGVPAAGIAYSRKFIGVYRSVGLEDAVVDLGVCDEECAAARLVRIYRERDRFSGLLEREITSVHGKLADEFKNIFSKNSFMT
jgi:colanic acid/amylovoran biosynthesis protein